ncbi:MAG: 3'-5' exonuclease, partial [Jiangellaceae bacterium]
EWTTGPMLGFDLECTSPDPLQARIVTASLVSVETGERPTVTAHLTDPGVDIPAEATAIHGVTTGHAREHGRPAAEVADLVAADLALAMSHGIPMVAMNAAYDATVLECELARHGLPSLADRLGGVVRPVLDPLVIDREVDRYRKGKRTLTALCEHYGVTLAGAHDSSADALAAVRLVRLLAERHASVGTVPLDDLHTAQAAWYRDWAESFAHYLRRQGNPQRADEVSLDWPVRPIPEGVAAP